MRLTHLSLPHFKNLRDFETDFADSELITVLIGPNGSGKTNLFEALVLIFRDIDLGRVPAFEFHLSYTCRGHAVRLSGSGGEAPKLTLRLDDSQLSVAEFRRRADELLPDHVFAYYSGPSNRLEGYFESHQERYLAALLRNDPRPLRRLFYARPLHSQFVLLAFFSADDDAGTRFLASYFGITALESVRFVLHEPQWSRARGTRGMGRDGDPRFWNARGLVAEFLDRVYDAALAPLEHEEPASSLVAGRRGRRETFLNLFLPTPAALQTLAGQYASQAEFFASLESTSLSDLIERVEIRVRKAELDEPMTFDQLSEGEQQLLTVLGLLRFTSRHEALFLLDEPDTHLNPAWSYEYLRLVEQITPQDTTTQILLATHDPVVIGGLVRDQVRVMQADGLTKTSAALRPELDPSGMGVAGLLTSELFGLKSTLDPATLDKITERVALWGMDERSPQQQERFDQLTRELAELGFNYEHADPLFIQFSSAINRRFARLASSLTQTEKEALDADADKMLAEILDGTE